MLRRFPIFCGMLCLLACGGGPDTEPDAAAPGTTTAGGQGSDGPREVVVFTPHGQELLDEFIALFEEAHPDINVVGTFVPTGKILSRLRIDKEDPQADVWWGGTSAFFGQAKAEGLLQPYEPSWSDNVPDRFHDSEHAWYAHFLQVPAVMFNRNIYEAAQVPGTFEGLLSPAWKDKIVIREPMNSGTMKTIYSGLVWSRGGAQGNPHPGYGFLESLDAQTRSYLPDPQALYDRIARSEAGYISLWNLTDIIFQSEANRYPFGYRIPSDPVPISLDPIAVVNGAPHLEEAKLFYEFVTSKESALRLAKNHYRIIARRDIPKEELPNIMEGIEFTAMELDLAEFDRHQIEWMQHWLDSIRDPEK